MPSPKQCANELSRQAYHRLLESRSAVLTMTTGGCARYAFSTEIQYCLDRKGHPLFVYASSNPHHHLVVTNTTMDLRLAHEIDPEGNELSILILTGMLRLVDPGDHDSLDRHYRYFDITVENYTRGSQRLYRFEAERAGFELFSGERQNLPLSAVIRKNAFTRKEEDRLLAYCRESMHARKDVIPVGVDGMGIDLRKAGGFERLNFADAVTTTGDVMAFVASCSKG